MNKTMNKRNGAIDFWKFVFFISLVIHHSKLFAHTKDTPFTGGAILVEFFFIVSGFLMAQSISHYDADKIVTSRGTTIRNFLAHKIRGMCPEIYVGWITGFFVLNTTENGVTFRVLCDNLITGVWDLLFLWGTGMRGFHANTVTWYISAMLLAMLLLLPLFLKDRDFFLNVLAPIITIFTLGFLAKKFGYLRAPSEWLGFCYSGFLRAIAEVSLGCVCWNVCRWLKQFHFKKSAKLLFFITELTCYISILVWSYRHRGTLKDFVIVLLFAIAITITFSKHGLLAPVFDNSIMYFLGKISFPIYLGHGYWAHAFANLYPDEAYLQLLPKYLLIAALTATFIYLTSNTIRIHAPKIQAFLKSLFIEEAPDEEILKTHKA